MWSRTADDPDIDYIIPARPAPDKNVVLNADQVARVRADTARVSGILSAIFLEDETNDELIDEVTSADNHIFRGLDRRHADFVNELLTRSHWEETEFQALANRFKMMAGGTLETVNEWSFEQFDDILIEEYEGYELNPEVMAELRS